MIKVNAAKFEKGFKDWLKAEQAVVTAAYRGLIAEVYTYVVEETPQYSGQSVSNWRIGVGSVEGGSSTEMKELYKASGKRGTRVPYTKAGHYSASDGGGGRPNSMAVLSAYASLGPTLRSITLDFGTARTGKVSIANNTQFGKDNGLGFKVTNLENPPDGWLRAVNVPGRMMARALSWVTQDQYSIVGAHNIGFLTRRGK